jgi:hypothetical protein
LPSLCPDAVACQQDKDVDQALRTIIGADTENEVPIPPEQTTVPNDGIVVPAKASEGVQKELTETNVTPVVAQNDDAVQLTVAKSDNVDDDVLTRTPPATNDQKPKHEVRNNQGEPIML